MKEDILIFISDIKTGVIESQEMYLKNAHPKGKADGELIISLMKGVVNRLQFIVDKHEPKTDETK